MEFSLDRFRSAHDGSYNIALQEIKAGRKQGHWMWYIFPQILGLGHSTEAMYYAIQNKEEAVRYWNDPMLRSHMLLNAPIGQNLWKRKRPTEMCEETNRTFEQIVWFW